MSHYICKNAILLLSFNRLDTTQQVFTQIAKVKPSRIYLASDGARENKIDSSGILESQKVAQVREYLLANITWDCEIKTRFLDKNLGCKYAVSSAISWFFENEAQGIILEDDCLPNESFFRFCDELLERYKNDKRVMMISGWSALDFAPNPLHTLSPKARIKESYFFSKYNHIWGWASWARAWATYQLDFSKHKFHKLNNFASNAEKDYWHRIFNAYTQGRIDTWDYPWTFSIWDSKGLCVYPKDNMIQNIGFSREDATHTKGESHFADMPSYELRFPLRHPQQIKQNIMLDKVNFEGIFAPLSLWKRLANKTMKLLNRGG